MSNRIDEAIQKILFTRKQQDILLEQIIKQSLFEGQAVAKIKQATKAEIRDGKQAGAEVVYAVVMRNISETNIAAGVAAATNSVGLSDPTNREENRIDIGANSTYATSQKEFIADPVKVTMSIRDIVGEYKYLIGNITKLGNRIRCVVWIVPMKMWQSYEQFVYSDEFYKDQDRGETFTAEGTRSSRIGVTYAKLMKDWIEKTVEVRGENIIDKKWYIDNQKELMLPPASWYTFAGLEPKKAISMAQLNNDKTNDDANNDKTNDDANNDKTNDDAKNNVQDDIIEVKDKKLKNGDMFSGTWNNTKSSPVNGTLTSSDGTIQFSGDFSYDSTSKEWWFNKGIRIANNGDWTEQGTFDQSGKFLEGTISKTIKDATDNSKTVWKYFLIGGSVDTTNNKSTATRYDASNKVISFYEGTIDLNIKPYTGTQYTDDTKTTIEAYFKLGEFIPK